MGYFIYPELTIASFLFHKDSASKNCGDSQRLKQGWVETGFCRDETGREMISRLAENRDETGTKLDTSRDQFETN